MTGVAVALLVLLFILLVIGYGKLNQIIEQHQIIDDDGINLLDDADGSTKKD